MGTVISFPERASTTRSAETSLRASVGGTATVIILPTIRIERHVDEPSAGRKTRSRSTTTRKRRIRASRS